MMKNQFIDFEAQPDSDDEFSEDEYETRQGDDSLSKTLERSEATLETSPNAQLVGPSKLDSLVERIENRYIQNPILNHSSQSPISNHSSQAAEQDFSAPLRQLSPEKQDWKLWRVKCTPRKEYFVIHDLMQRHKTLSDELCSVFYNSRDIGFLYLEAEFTKSGISSLREVLREYSDLKLSSIALVPEADWQRCLTLGENSQSTQQVFAGGQWVHIKRGLYRGDVGLVLEDFRDEDSSTGVRVSVIPRLEFTNEDYPSSSKRKRRIRPSPRLFNPTECDTEQLVRHRRPHVFSYATWHFEYGLQIKTYSARSLTLAQEVSASAFQLFMDAKTIRMVDCLNCTPMTLNTCMRHQVSGSWLQHSCVHAEGTMFMWKYKSDAAE